MPSVCVAQVLRSVTAPISLSEQHTSCNFESSSEQWRTYATLSSDGQFYQVQQVHATSLECNYNKCTKYIIVESAHLRERERERERGISVLAFTQSSLLYHDNSFLSQYYCGHEKVRPFIQTSIIIQRRWNLPKIPRCSNRQLSHFLRVDWDWNLHGYLR